MVVQYSELRPTSGWDLLASLRHPCKFQCVSRLGSVTARQSSSGHQPNFAALYIGRHLYSAGRPSRWAFAHILVELYSTGPTWIKCLFSMRVLSRCLHEWNVSHYRHCTYLPFWTLNLYMGLRKRCRVCHFLQFTRSVGLIDVWT